MAMVAGGQLFGASAEATNHVLLMTGHPPMPLLAMVAAAITGLVASLALVPAFGILGAALSDAGITVLANTIALADVRKALNLWAYDRRYLKPLIAGS